MLVDTDILIDYLRGHADAVSFLEGNVDDVSISAVSVAELYQGVREGQERTRLSRMISALVVLPLTEEIAETAGLYRRDYRDRLGCGLADCMIAATASEHRLDLATLNGKHFQMLKGVILPYAKS
ncbi:MAG: type II toxin-antitoxin system VapC family toxin [Verrucomicrobiae bacterium]|nr:type II toxin-antitoxin system VapC family toxin [Verrucomicrobiae bacterium]MCP5539952.1 type II toxin-antitoxin system VapC family toxin [Akkermansiaceae bacterium]MCP5549885.1 type II toxin-antitoxin system VapC family toxin [Akkermansiaceae bacterium]